MPATLWEPWTPGRAARGPPGLFVIAAMYPVMAELLRGIAVRFDSAQLDGVCWPDKRSELLPSRDALRAGVNVTKDNRSWAGVASE